MWPLLQRISAQGPLWSVSGSGNYLRKSRVSTFISSILGKVFLRDFQNPCCEHILSFHGRDLRRYQKGLWGEILATPLTVLLPSRDPTGSGFPIRATRSTASSPCGYRHRWELEAAVFSSAQWTHKTAPVPSLVSILNIDEFSQWA
jgi:hypothetical protein